MTTHPDGCAPCNYSSCPALRADLSLEHPINAAHCAQQAAAAAAASGQRGPRPTSRDRGQSDRRFAPHVGDVVAESDRRSRQLSTLARVRPPWGAFAGPAATTVAKAMKRAGTHLHNKKYLAVSTGLTEYIRSGSMIDPAFAAPVLAATAFPEEKDTEASVVAYIASTMADRRKAVKPLTQLTHFRDYVATLVSSIIPALIDRPAAIMEWATLTRNAIEIERHTDWPRARKYIMDQLRVKTQEQLPIGYNDPELSDPILHDAAINAKVEARQKASEEDAAAESDNMPEQRGHGLRTSPNNQQDNGHGREEDIGDARSPDEFEGDPEADQ